MVSLPDDIVAASDAAFGDTSSDDDQAANDTLASTDLAHHQRHRDDEEAREDARDTETDLEADHHHHHHTGQHQEPSTSSIINKQLEDASATATATTTTTSNEAQHRQSEPEDTHDPAVCPVCLITVLEGPALFKYRFHAICAVCRQCRRPLSETLGFSVVNQDATCTECAMQCNAPCTLCGDMIVGRGVYFFERPYHHECVRCVECNKPYRPGRTFHVRAPPDVDGDAATRGSGDFLCRLCHARWSQEQESQRLVHCARCLLEMTLGDAVQIGGKAWHPGCSTCSVCGNTIKKGSSMSLQRGALWCAVCTRESIAEALENRKAYEEARQQQLELERRQLEERQKAEQLEHEERERLETEQRLERERLEREAERERLEQERLERELLEAETYHVCMLCQESLQRKEGLALASHIWHIECAECAECGEALNDATFFALLQQRMWCIRCAAAEVRRTEQERLEAAEAAAAAAEAESEVANAAAGASASEAASVGSSQADTGAASSSASGGHPQPPKPSGFLSVFINKLDEVALATRARLLPGKAQRQAQAQQQQPSIDGTPTATASESRNAAGAPSAPSFNLSFESMSEDERRSWMQVQADVARLQKEVADLAQLIQKRERETLRVQRKLQARLKANAEALVHGSFRLVAPHNRAGDDGSEALELDDANGAAYEDGGSALSGVLLDAIDEELDRLDDRTRQDVIRSVNASGTTVVQMPQANLIGEDLSYLTLSNSNFSAADLSQCNLYACVMIGAQFRFANLSGANATWAKFRSASFFRASMRECNLSNASLEGANLINADLSHCNLTAAIAHGASFAGATLRSVNLERAKLADAVLTKTDLSNANVRRADLTKVNLTQADCSCANFEGADLSGADLSASIFRGCNLRGAKLNNARLVDRSGKRADFTDADLSDADLTGVLALVDRESGGGAAAALKALFQHSNLTRILGFKDSRMLTWSDSQPSEQERAKNAAAAAEILAGGAQISVIEPSSSSST